MDHTENPAGIGRIAAIVSWVFMVGALALSASALNTVRVLGGMGDPVAPREELLAADMLSFSASMFYLLTYLVAGIAILRWVYVVNRNAQTWSTFVDVTPGWNVGWFFVPVASLFKPFEGVRETYQASIDPEEPGAVPVPGVMRWWWGAWLAGNFHGWLSFAVFGRGEGIDGLIAARWFTASAGPILIVQVVAFAAVVRLVTRAQVARLGLG